MTELVIRTDRDRQRVVGFLQALPQEKPHKVVITEIRSKRSDAQNRLLWMWNGAIQQHMRDTHGQIAASEEWHDILVAKLWPAEVHAVELPDGTRYKVGRAKTRKFNVTQMTTYLELLDAYCAECLGLLLPHPEDLMMAIYGQRSVA